MSGYAELYGKTERKLFTHLYSGDNLNSIKCEFLKKFGMNARQFNSVSAGLKGKISSIKELRVNLIRESEQRIVSAKKVLKRISDPAKKHQKKRRVEAMQTRLKNLKADRASGKVRLCFGSKNGYLAKCHEHAEFIPLGRGKVPCDYVEKCYQEHLRKKEEKVK